MKLKAKFLKWNAGFPVVILNEKVASRLGVRAKNRICVETDSDNPKQMYFIVDIFKELTRENEIAFSKEAKKRIGVKKGQEVEVSLAFPPKSFDYIRKKIDGTPLKEKQMHEIIKDVVNNSLSEAEVSLFISAMYTQGTSFKETIYLIKALLKTGNKLSLTNKYIVDKHSIGGIPGNRTTPIVVSICAAEGLTFPKSSSRAITSPAGTADVIETISDVEFDIKTVKKIIKKTKGCLVWGGSLGIVPADSRIIQIEKSLRIDPRAQLLASIMSKKLAMGSEYILIDIPYGKNAKVNKKQALEIKKDFEKIGKYFDKKIKIIFNKNDEPMGEGVGPVLELLDVLKILNPDKKGPEDLQEKSLKLAGEIFEMTGKVKKEKGYEKAKKILESGKAYKKFKEIIEAQNGRVFYPKPGKFKKEIISKKDFNVSEIHTKKITSIARVLGCPSDKKAGIRIHTGISEKVKKGQKIATLYSESEARLKKAVNLFNQSPPIN